jgi:hypothetical protein
MAGLRHLSMMMVPSISGLAVGWRSGQLRVLRVTWFGRWRGCRAMVVVMVFHVALPWWPVRSDAQWPLGPPPIRCRTRNSRIRPMIPSGTYGLLGMLVVDP